MKTLTINEFCDKHNACVAGRRWALANCTTMQEVWERCEKYSWMLWIIQCKGVLTHQELIQFALWSARQVQHLTTDPRCVAALDCVENYLCGKATQEDCRRAAAAANVADAANAAAANANAAANATYAAANANAAAAAYAAYAAYAAAYANAANAAAKKAQLEWLRKNVKPNFTYDSLTT